jgi:hypothetical protein
MFIMGRTRRGFTPEYKDEAVKLVINTGRTVSTVARELGSTYSHPSQRATITHRSRRGKTMIDPMLARVGPLTLLTIPTYEGSGMAVHPSVYYNPDGWNGCRYWMAMTPYPLADSTKENPSILCSVDGSTWVVPTGLTNPIDPYPGGSAYNSDPYLTADSTGLMWCWWRTVFRTAGPEVIAYRTSTDGVAWSAMVTEWNYDYAVTGYRLIAPSVIQQGDGTWVMYAVDIFATPYRVVRSVRDTDGTWSAPQTVTIKGGASGTQPWHIDVHKAGSEWQMLVMDSGASGGDLWAAVSPNGLDFVAGPKFVARGTGWNSAYYKSCFIPATKDGVAGWDAWLGGLGGAGATWSKTILRRTKRLRHRFYGLGGANATWSAAGPTIARTFIQFDQTAT